MDIKIGENDRDAVVFAKTIEQEALSQIYKMAYSDIGKDAHIRIMPDCHAGAGCVIGTTMQITDEVCPNLVGVDIGCLDYKTEVLTQNGWIKIADYSNQKILVYDKTVDSTFFDMPYVYIKQPCEKFYHIYSHKGLDQMVSSEHKMLIWNGYKGRGFNIYEKSAEEVVSNHNEKILNSKKPYGGIKTSFSYVGDGVPYSDNMIRIITMISADGRIKELKNEKVNTVELHFAKTKKVNRTKMLLDYENIKYNEYTDKSNCTYISFNIGKEIAKDLKIFYKASKHQLHILADECLYWDGHIGYRSYYSTSKKTNADVIQFAFAANNIRAGISKIEYQNEKWNAGYQVYPTKNNIVGFPREIFKEYKSQDGYKYCFTTSTGFFIIRRNNNISVTGNCGVALAKSNLKFENIFEKLDSVIREDIPYGMDVYNSEQPWNFEKLRCWDKLQKENRVKARMSLGTLGGGNHFIEAYADGYISVHSGSRNIGYKVAQYYQKLAVKNIKDKRYRTTHEDMMQVAPALREKWLKSHKINVDDDLCYLDGQYMEDYLHDVSVMQEFAKDNRAKILRTIIEKLGGRIDYTYESVHNYIDTENMILRKGAISAKDGEVIVIPMNMRDGLLICRGKGNEEWNCSAPHGAGRLYSRSKAKSAFTVDQYREAMKGIFTTCINEATLDEAPFVYKDFKEIEECIEPTAYIEDRLLPIFNFKADN